MFCSNYAISFKTMLNPVTCSFWVHAPEIAKVAVPGQFVHISVPGFTLRRPISICDIDKEEIRLVMEKRGEGTDILATYNVTELLDMIAPLGRGFTLPQTIENGKRIIVVGGGIGTPPLLPIAKKYGDKVTAILGFKSSYNVILNKDFENFGSNVIVCTQNGTEGVKGMVTLPLEEELAKNDVAMVYTCGPMPMMKAVVALCKEYKTPCEVSLEERMGCGVGACEGCACKISRYGKEFTLRVCKDGPVFKGEEVVGFNS